MVMPTPTATPRTAATIGLLQRTSAGRKRSAGRLKPPVISAALRKSAGLLPAENAPGNARDQHAMDGIISVRALKRSRHRLVHQSFENPRRDTEVDPIDRTMGQFVSWILGRSDLLP
jgi:hypothetical protein